MQRQQDSRAKQARQTTCKQLEKTWRHSICVRWGADERDQYLQA
jgi:hypothetical protein